ncbi:hypothetical protein L6R52_25975 [Myxococcota bacterium]|nr:hypothetical protein [Myxococcota bacterium]
MRRNIDQLQESLGRFVEAAQGNVMHEAASTLLELLESDAVEPITVSGALVSAEDVADRLESKVEKLMKNADEPPEGIDLIEEAVAHLRAHEDTVAPWTFEDGDGIRWFVLASGEDVVACYTSAPFLAAS